MNEDFLVISGGSIKSLNDSGKVGGYLALFGPENVDLQSEFFSPDCDFWLEAKSLLPMIYDHGRSPEFRRKKLTHVRFERHDQGLWIEGRLPIQDSPAIEQLWEQVKRDELGLSSGTAGHLAGRVPRGSVTEIVEWPITEASLARRPAQPKSRAVALKSLPLSDFEIVAPKSQDYYNQLAAIEYAKLLQIQHELRMMEIRGRI